MYQSPGSRETRSGPHLEGPRLGLVIVHYRTPEHLLRLLHELNRQGFPGPVVVVDTSEEDLLQAPRAMAIGPPASLHWIARPDNPGFGAAVAQGLAVLPALPYYAICNADVLPQPGAFQHLTRFLDRHPAAGLVGPRVLDPEGHMEPSWGRPITLLREALYRFRMRRYRSPILQRYWRWWARRPRRVGWVTGACFVVRRDAWTAAGGFDPAFFLYYEDCDLCLRVTRQGWEVWLVPGAEVVHHRGASVRSYGADAAARARRQSQWYYYQKHRPAWEQRALALYFRWLGVPRPRQPQGGTGTP